MLFLWGWEKMGVKKNEGKKNGFFWVREKMGMKKWGKQKWGLLKWEEGRGIGDNKKVI